MSREQETIPGISHLQFVILDALGANVKRGKELRADLAESGVKKTGPSFYQLMARLEEARFVEGWYEQQIIDGQIIKEKHYRILGNGIRAVNQMKNFYRNRMAPIKLAPALA
jgi:DNA-binding PadR family transcriptional regulator